MKLARNMFFLFVVTIFAVASLILDTFNYNPYQSGNSVFINFFISLYFSVGGVSSFVIYFMKMKFSKSKAINSFFFPSVRQGAIVAAGATLLLILRTLQILDWWVAGPMVIAIILLELFFQTASPIKKQAKSNQNI